MHEENEACAEGKRKGRRKKHRFEEEGIAGGGRGKPQVTIFDYRIIFSCTGRIFLI